MEAVEKDMHFISTQLIPEMVNNRCFCESNSREFIELITVDIKPIQNDSKFQYNLHFSCYRATVIVEFSGEAETFHILIKLLPEDSLLNKKDNTNLSLAYDGFVNEEILFNKATRDYGNNFFPISYAADMGRYGRPVIVIEDLEKRGFERVRDRKLYENEARSIFHFLGNFHGKGMLLRETKFQLFHELIAKFQDTLFSQSIETETRENFSGFLNTLKGKTDSEQELRIIRKLLENDTYLKYKDDLIQNNQQNISTICHGFLTQDNIWFRRKRGSIEIAEVKVLDWQKVRYGPVYLDLVTLFMQCAVEDWAILFNNYVETLENIRPMLAKEKLQEGMKNSGLLYALLISSFERDKYHRISSCEWFSTLDMLNK